MHVLVCFLFLKLINKTCCNHTTLFLSEKSAPYTTIAISLVLFPSLLFLVMRFVPVVILPHGPPQVDKHFDEAFPWLLCKCCKAGSYIVSCSSCSPVHTGGGYEVGGDLAPKSTLGKGKISL